ncbi:hypothetical protein C3L33_23173, partial [Rhododendron williamsianum]
MKFSLPSRITMIIIHLSSQVLVCHKLSLFYVLCGPVLLELSKSPEEDLSPGVGYSHSLSSVAALNCVLKDGLGRLSRCIYTASLASALDTNLKRVRFSTSVLFSSSIGVESLTPAFPQYFLILATIANIAKQMSLACHLATGLESKSPSWCWIETSRMLVNPTFLDDDLSSDSGEDANMLDGHNTRQPTTPSSGRRTRSRTATGDAIVDDMLETAAASKMRATEIMKNEDRFSISKCIKYCTDLSTGMEDFELELDEKELVAAAAGYHYYYSLTKQPRRSRNESPCGTRMDKHVFQKLCGALRQKGMLRDTPGVMIEELLGIFMNIVGHNERNRVIQERFEHSGETISRHFNNVLKAVKP